MTQKHPRWILRKQVRNYYPWISATQEIADRFSDRIAVGDHIYFARFGLNRDDSELRVAIFPETIKATVAFHKTCLIATAIVMTLLTVLTVFLIVWFGVKPIKRISSDLENLATTMDSEGAHKTELKTSWNHADSAETQSLQMALQQFTQAYQKNVAKIGQLETAKSMGDMAAQVAHDIRAPLAAFEAVMSDTYNIPDSRRKIIRGALASINETANNLLAQYRQDRHTKSDSKRPILVSGLIEEIVAEVRSVQANKITITTLIDPEVERYNAFILASRNSFKRALTNLLSNAIEACAARDHPTISIRCLVTDGLVNIKIEDNGVGIPAAILDRVFEHKFTYGKANGSGLGLSYVKEFVAGEDGRVGIKSIPGEGTCVDLTIPTCARPSWHTDTIDLGGTEQVVILDDNEYMAQTVKGKVETAGFDGPIHCFSTGGSCEAWLADNQENLFKTRFLFDHELVGSTLNGAEILVKHGIEGRAVLVTSMYDQEDLQDYCMAHGIRILAKNFLKSVKFRRDTQNDIKGVLLDDNLYTRLAWQDRANAAHLAFACVSTPAELFALLETIPKTTPIFIDQNLGDDIKGVDLLKEIDHLGFSRLYLATGDAPENFRNIKELSGVIGKAPPAWLFSS